MPRIMKIFSKILVCLVCMVRTIPMIANPFIPFNFYDLAKISPQIEPDSNLAQAFVFGRMYAASNGQKYLVNFGYDISILGDNTNNTQKEGGRVNDSMLFKIGEAVTDQIGTRKSGANLNLNLPTLT
jgi:hypothetical protein